MQLLRINYYTFFFLLLFLPINAIGQQAELGSWNVLHLKYNHSKKISYFSELQLRSLKLYDHFHYHEVKGGVTLSLIDGFAFTLGLGNYQTYAEGGNFETPKNNNELRIWPQIVFSQTVKKIKIEQRYRAEMRWTSNGYRNRFRYRLGIMYPFGTVKKGFKPFQLGVSNELFFTNNEPFFERNRIQFTFNHRLSQQLMLQLGYVHQFDYKINDETGRDFLMLGVYFDLFNKK